MKIIQREFDKPLKGRTEGVVIRANTEMSTNHQNGNVTFAKG
jgi:hypothetical protein